MAGSDAEESQKLTFNFLRGVEGDAGVLEWPDGADVVRNASRRRNGELRENFSKPTKTI